MASASSEAPPLSVKNAHCNRCGNRFSFPVAFEHEAVTATLSCSMCKAAMMHTLSIKGSEQLLTSIVETDVEVDRQILQEALETEQRTWSGIMQSAPDVPGVRQILHSLRDDRIKKMERDLEEVSGNPFDKWRMKMDVTVHCNVCGKKITDVVVAQFSEPTPGGMVMRRCWSGPVLHDCIFQGMNRTCQGHLTHVTFQEISATKGQVIMVTSSGHLQVIQTKTVQGTDTV